MSECCGLDWSDPGAVQVESSCELGNEPLVSIEMLGIYRVAAQLVAFRVVLRSAELVS
jgi:hypothetical protein